MGTHEVVLVPQYTSRGKIVRRGASILYSFFRIFPSMKKPAEKKILTLHPEGKRGVNIAVSKYEQISEFIMDVMRRQEEVTFKELCAEAVEKLTNTFEGSVLWYLESVKLDLEANGVIERIPERTPQVLRIRKK